MSAQNVARYALADDGAIRHWLVCGPVLSPLDVLDRVVQPEGSPFGPNGRWIINYWAFDPASISLKKRVYQALPPFEWKPETRPQLLGPGIAEQPWQYAVTGEDNVADFSRFNFTPTLMQAWVFACLEAEQAMELDAEIITIGPARLWVNGVLVTHYAERFSYVANQYIPVRVPLKPGLNDIYLHGEMLSWREARLALGLRFPSRPAVSIGLPLGSVDAEGWQQAERGLENLLVTQFAFPQLPGRISLHPEAPEAFPFDARVHIPKPSGSLGTILAPLDLPEGHNRQTLAPGETGVLPITRELASALSTLPGENSAVLALKPANEIPLAQHREIFASANRFQTVPYGDYDSRRREALEHLANMAAHDILSSMAAVEIGKSDRISSDAIDVACHYMNNRYDCADFYSVALLALLYWMGEDPALDRADREKIERAFTGFKFWIDEPGLDAMCYFTENHQILFHVTAYLAGQLWPQRVFSNSGLTGAAQVKRHRPRIESWILRRLAGNFSEWDSNAYLTLDTFAMLALAEFAESARIREMATALLHKIFFLTACQSYRGAHGSTHGRCYVAALKSARVENTSNLQRIAWGMGILNGETRATGLLAMARRYRVPGVIQAIGADLPDVLVTRVRSKADFRPQFDMKAGTWDVRTMTRRTPDGMLSAALDFRPGEMGIQEHLWQAMLGPEAAIFTTYPGNSQEHGHARPNFWAGSARLPRVAMHDRAVVCLYKLEPGVGLGFTHAYFPAAAFDEYRIEGAWAFARVGTGYAALWADGDLKLTERGRHAMQELRTQGPGEVWVCAVGREAEDGSFAQFQEALRRSQPAAEGRRVRWKTPAGETLEFGWEGPLLVGGVAQDWSQFPHYENQYTQTAMSDDMMRIAFGDEVLVLDLKRGRVLEAQTAGEGT